MTRPETFLLFVYGTLKRGGCRHGSLARQAFLGPARTLARYALYDLGDYPGLKEDEDGQVVHGELYAVECHLRGLLDKIEGAPDWFSLRRVALDGIEEPVWAYYYQQEPGDRPRIDSGVWDNR
jgi:gamma-glutamylaminecyclotransferase